MERFNPFIDELDSLVPDPGMIEVTDGGWVRYEDYEKLKRERDELHEKFLEFALFTQDFVKRHFPQ